MFYLFVTYSWERFCVSGFYIDRGAGGLSADPEHFRNVYFGPEGEFGAGVPRKRHWGRGLPGGSWGPHLAFRRTLQLQREEGKYAVTVSVLEC